MRVQHLTGALVGIFFLTGCKQSFFEAKMNDDFRKFKVTASQNLKLERVTQEQVESFFITHPPFPHYSHMINAKKNFEQYKVLSEKFSRNDKEKHCFMGYLLAKNHDSATSVFLAYYKEALDVGDANGNSHFEIADMIATRIGASYFKKNYEVERCLKVNEVLPQRVGRYEEARVVTVKRIQEEMRRFEEVSRFENRR